MIKDGKLDLISNVLNDFFKERITSKLEEKQEDMSIDFISDRQIFLSFSFDKKLLKDKFPSGLFPFFNRGEPKVCSFCDYIIFSEYKGQLYVLLIELKSGKSNATKQLEAAKCFTEYIIATVNRVYQKEIQAEIRKIGIRKTSVLSKKQKQKPIVYDENNFHSFSDSKFWLRKYLI